MRKNCNKKFRYFILLICTLLTNSILAYTTSSFNFNVSTPKYEARAVWLTTIGGLDWPHNYARDAYTIKQQKQELIRILDQLKAANINIVFLQTRVRGTVIYPSSIEPWDGCVSGNPGISPGYDPLQFAIDECHKRGMQLHAWVVCIPIGENRKEGVKHMKRVHPELYLKIKDHGFMRPDKEGTGDYIADICREITRNYDIDGIHLDYIRYPEEATLPGQPQWKRDNITRIVRKINYAVKTIKPWVMLSCSPVGKYSSLPRYNSKGWNAYGTVFQDAQGWLREGLMDALFPMMYFQGNNFYPFAADWKENCYGRIVAPGLGIYFMHPKEKNWPLQTITQEMHVLRQFGLGHAYFRSKFFTDNTKRLYDVVYNTIDNYPSLIPAMSWMSKAKPIGPTELTINSTSEADIISWKGAKNQNDSPYLLYNIYRSTEYPVDIQNAKNLIATRVLGNTISCPKSSSQTPYNYTVTAVDRYGNESVVTINKGQNLSKVNNLEVFPNDGSKLQLPKKGKFIDADYLLVKDMSGKDITTIRWNGTTGYIDRLKDGNYQIYSLNHKGITHRLGFFQIKRKD